MKRVGLMVVWLFLVMPAWAQTFSEWFRQKSTQIKYLHKQIAALQVLIGDLEDGYAIVEKGTGIIGMIQQQDQDQHRDHFADLKRVNPAIEKDARIEKIREWRQMIMEHCRACRQVVGSGHWLDKNELDFVGRRLGSLSEDAAMDCSLLDRVLMGGYLQMTDDERLRRIGEIYDAMKNRLVAALAFRLLVERVIIFRQREKDEVEGMRALYGLNQE